MAALVAPLPIGLCLSFGSLVMDVVTTVGLVSIRLGQEGVAVPVCSQVHDLLSGSTCHIYQCERGVHAHPLPIAALLIWCVCLQHANQVLALGCQSSTMD